MTQLDISKSRTIFAKLTLWKATHRPFDLAAELSTSAACRRSGKSTTAGSEQDTRSEDSTDPFSNHGPPTFHITRISEGDMSPGVAQQLRVRAPIGNSSESDPGDKEGKARSTGVGAGNGNGNDDANGDGIGIDKKRGREGGSNPYILNLILAKTLRFLGQIGFLWHTYLLRPRGHWPSTTRSVRMRDGGFIDLYIYLPKGSHSGSGSGQSVGAREGAEARAEGVDKDGKGTEETKKKKTCVINFHGGGWSIGSPTDDSRWALFCTSPPLNSIFISVNYRLAPEHPFPTPVLDCIDATRWIVKHADELGVDRERVVLSGFSAGGCLTITTAIGLMNPELERGLDVVKYALESSASARLRLPDTKSNSTDPGRTPSHTQSHTDSDSESDHSQVPRIRLKGLIPFYPLVDFSTPRTLKLSRSPDPKSMKPLPGWLTKMFDSGYLPLDNIDRHHPFISPLFASHELLKDLPSVHFVLCGADVLAQEGQDMADRLRGLYTADSDPDSDRELVPDRMEDTAQHTSADEMSKSLEHSAEREVIARWVKGARHGWDKPPHLVRQSVIDEYTAAIDSIKRWCS